MYRCTASPPASGRALAVWVVIWLFAATAGAQPAALETVRCQAVLAPGELRPGDFFGCALDAAGSLSVVGSVQDDGAGTDAGAVYVYRGGTDATGGGGFQQVAKVTAAAVRPGDRLGFAVATDGSRFIAGSPFHDGPARDSGGAWVFAQAREGVAGWGEQAQLAVGSLGGGLGGSDQFGYSVALDGPWAAAGAPGDDDRGDAAGAVYVFSLGRTGWQPFAKLTASDGAVGDGFGASLSLSGDTLLVGAPYRDGPGREAGAVYVYRLAGGSWSPSQTLAGDGGGSSLFGHAVDVVGSRAAVGARGDDRGGANSGTAYLYRGDGGGSFVLEQRLTVPAAAAGDELGMSVAVGDDGNGELALVGARFDDQEVENSGAVYLFRRGADGIWQATQKLKQETPGAGDELGYAVALAGGRLIAGAYLDDDAGSDAGLVCEAQTAPSEPPCIEDCPAERTDLGVSVVCPATATPGLTMSWTVTVTNNGPGDAPAGGTLTVPLPAGVLTTTAACTPPVACTTSGRSLVATLPAVTAGAALSTTVTASLAPAALGNLALSAAVSLPAQAGGSIDPAAGNDAALCSGGSIRLLPRASYGVVHGTPTLSFDAKVALPEPGTDLAQVTFPVQVTNRGPSDARAVRVSTQTSTAPATLAVLTGSTCGTETCELGTLAAGDTRSLTFTYVLPRSCGVGEVALTQTVLVTSTTDDAQPPAPDPASDDVSSATAVPPAVEECPTLVPALGPGGLALLALLLAAAGWIALRRLG